MYMKWPRVCVGSDSTVARCQIQGQRGVVFCTGQQRILRALFWLGRWLGFPWRAFMYLLVVTQRIRLAECTNLTG